MIKIISNKDNMIFLESSKKEDFIDKEIIIFDGKYKGFIISCSEKNATVAMLDDSSSVNTSSNIMRTNQSFSISLKKDMLGKVYNYDMKEMDFGIKPKNKSRYVLTNSKKDLANLFVYSYAHDTNIDSREIITKPMYTGKIGIDSILPIGRGQRQLIIGDRRTGKTFIALSSIIAQNHSNLICVYVSIGGKESGLIQFLNKLRKNNSLKHTVIISSSSNDTAAANHIAPYVGMTIAETFKNEGKDVLIIFDDLSKHARAYRSISLVSGASAGRDAYPGDIFYNHSRLLERAGNFNKNFGGGSITALPIIETQQEDISNYISTNIISITDGQIFTSAKDFNMYLRPAINIPLSVSRIGGQAQIKAIRDESGSLKNLISQAQQILKISVNQNSMSNVNKEIILKYNIFSQLSIQAEDDILAEEEQLVLLILLNFKMLDYFKIRDIDVVKKSILNYIRHYKSTSKFMLFLKKEIRKKTYDKNLISHYIKMIFNPFILWLFSIHYKDDIKYTRSHLYSFRNYDNRTFNKETMLYKDHDESSLKINEIEKTIMFNIGSLSADKMSKSDSKIKKETSWVKKIKRKTK